MIVRLFFATGVFLLGLAATAQMRPPLGVCPLTSENTTERAILLNPKVWSLCEMDELKSYRTFLKFSSRAEKSDHGVPQSDQLLSTLDSAYLADRDGIVSVSSVLEDVTDGKSYRVSGLGSIILTGQRDSISRVTKENLLQGRYFVLTAGHISMGADLTVKMSDGYRLPIRNLFHLQNLDLSLIEIDIERSRLYVFPFAYFVKAESADILVSHLLKPVRYGLPEAYLEPVAETFSKAEYKVIASEGLNGMMLSQRTATGVVIPTWVPDKNIPRQDFAPEFNLDRKVLADDLSIPMAFPRGLSGAPLVIGRAYEHRDQHNLAGVLTLVRDQTSGKPSTVSATTKRIYEFVKKVLQNAPTVKEKSSWHLMQGRFVQWTGTSLDLYLKSGPIGNGVVIDGRLGSEDTQGPLSLERELLNQKVRPANVEKILHRLKKIEFNEKGLPRYSLPSRLEQGIQLKIK